MSKRRTIIMKKDKDIKLLKKMGCDYIPAVFTGDKEKDDRANAELYLQLVREGEEKGFCPVLVDRDIGHNVTPEKYGLTESKADYPKVTERLIELAKESCFSVWMGRLIYNYFLDGEDIEELVAEDLELLEPPSDKEYLDIFKRDIKEKDFSFGDADDYKPFGYSYEDEVFVLVPVKEPWKILAWIPMGGFNWCPEPVHQVALAKGLYDQFGARIMSVSSTCLEYYVPDPIISKDGFEKAARILIAADNDVYEDYEVSARRILGSHNWYLWWD